MIQHFLSAAVTAKLCFFAVLPLLVPVSVNAQAWSPDGKKIAFFYIHTIEDIYLVNSDGSDFEIVDKHAARDFAPQWSPDGRNIIFTSVRDGHHELYKLDLDSKSLKRLTNTASDSQDGCYSPNGKYIIFSGNRNGNAELYRMDKNGAHLRQLTFTPDFDEHSPKWSSDGKKIVFVGKAKGEESDIWIMDSAGKKRTRITQTPEPEFHASLSKDGTKISYIKVYDGAFEVHRVDINGKNDRVLVRKKGYQAFFPHWSPDGKFIAFTRDVMEGTVPGLPALYKVDMEGNEQLISDKNSFR
ncbi:MAG: TolB family protein [Sinomicrobium sp.]|nr:TolB family protein [Sinomicrobium sp.]